MKGANPMLHGSLDNFELSDVLGLLERTAKSGRLRVTGDRGTGSLWLEEGALVNGIVGVRTDASMEEMVFELMRFEVGDFAFVADERASEASAEPEVVSDTVAAATARLAEWREIEAVVPSLAHIVSPVLDLPGDDVTLSNTEWHVLVATCPSATVETICTALDLGEVDGSREVRRLVERGLLTVSEPAAGTGRSASDVAAPGAVAGVYGGTDLTDLSDEDLPVVVDELSAIDDEFDLEALGLSEVEDGSDPESLPIELFATEPPAATGAEEIATDEIPTEEIAADEIEDDTGHEDSAEEIAEETADGRTAVDEAWAEAREGAREDAGTEAAEKEVGAPDGGDPFGADDPFGQGGAPMGATPSMTPPTNPPSNPPMSPPMSQPMPVPRPVPVEQQLGTGGVEGPSFGDALAIPEALGGYSSEDPTAAPDAFLPRRRATDMVDPAPFDGGETGDQPGAIDFSGLTPPDANDQPVQPAGAMPPPPPPPPPPAPGDLTMPPAGAMPPVGYEQEAGQEDAEDNEHSGGLLMRYLRSDR